MSEDAVVVFLHALIQCRDRLAEAAEVRGGLAADELVQTAAVSKFNALMTAAQIPDDVDDAAVRRAARLGGDATKCVRAAKQKLSKLAERVRRNWPPESEALATRECRALNEAFVALRPYATCERNVDGIPTDPVSADLACHQLEQARYEADRPELGDILAEIVRFLTPLEEHRRTRLSRKYKTQPQWRAAALLACELIEQEEGEKPMPDFGAWFATIRAGLQSAFPGITEGDVLAALAEGVNKGALRSDGDSYRIVARPVAAGQSRRVKLRIADDAVTVEGKSYRLRGGNDAAFLRVLLENRGVAVKADALERAIRERPSRIYARLPERIQKLIDKPGRGQRGYILH